MTIAGRFTAHRNLAPEPQPAAEQVVGEASAALGKLRRERAAGGRRHMARAGG